jgi:hypothetical protein
MHQTCGSDLFDRCSFRFANNNHRAFLGSCRGRNHTEPRRRRADTHLAQHGAKRNAGYEPQKREEPRRDDRPSVAMGIAFHFHATVPSRKVVITTRPSGRGGICCYPPRKARIFLGIGCNTNQAEPGSRADPPLAQHGAKRNAGYEPQKREESRRDDSSSGLCQGTTSGVPPLHASLFLGVILSEERLQRNRT